MFHVMENKEPVGFKEMSEMDKVTNKNNYLSSILDGYEQSMTLLVRAIE